MAKTQNNEPDIEDRDANIRLAVSHIISAKQDEMFEQFDRLHRRGIHDDDVVAALRSLDEEDLLDAYAEWAEIDLREDDNTTMNPAVPDPGDAPGYAPLEEQLAGLQRIREAHAAWFPPRPLSREGLIMEIDALEREYIGKFHHSAEFHAKARLAGNFLDQLESVHQLGDHERAGFLLAALLERGVTA